MDGLTALITGGGSGIGFATARLLLAKGANVMIVGRDQAKLKNAVEQLGDHNGRLRFTTGDVSSEGYANKIILDTVKAFGNMNVLVNCAGVIRGGRLLDMTEEDFDYVVDVNLKGTWFMCKFGSRALKKAGGGSIVNVSSVLALQGFPGSPASAYSASKGGVLGLTRALAIELAPDKVRVNAVIPALIDTPMLHNFAGADTEKILERSKKLYPAGRVGEADDVAHAIYYLSNPKNNWITGIDLRVDGGITIC
ncbi:MAG TPA: SDR family NAD(P)-dependent oxidoreductase [Chroococcales cyanobacterium]